MNPAKSPAIRSWVAALGAGLLFAPLAMAGWKNNVPASIIIGQTKLPSASTLYSPSGMAFSPATGKVFVVDGGQHRILRFSSSAALGNGEAAEAVLGQPDFGSTEFGTSATMLNDPGQAVIDAAGNLWVADSGNSRVLRWANADTLASGSPAIQVLGQLNFDSRSGTGLGASRLQDPESLALDPAGRLWVLDRYSHRVVWFETPLTKGNGAAADGVVGQADFDSYAPGTSAQQFRNPFDIAVDGQGRLWVADVDNARVLRFDQPTAQNYPAANGVLGQPDFISTATGSGPAQNSKFFHLTTYGDSLFVFDAGNQRIMRWDGAATKADGAPADGVLGRSSLESNATYPGTAGASIIECSDIQVDPAGRFWAVQWRNERVLRWDQILAKAPLAAADGVIGAPDVDTTPNSSFNPATQPWKPRTGLEDPATGRFFLADSGRVLRYASRVAAENGAAPEAVLGKPSVSEYGYGYGTISGVNLRSTWGLALDSAGQLWVSDPEAHRVVSFAQAATAPTGSPMAVVLGQSSFTASSSGLAADRLDAPKSLAIDASGNLYVADSGNHRVLRFANIAGKTTGSAADAVIGQADFQSASTAADSSLLRRPHGVCSDSEGRLWVADTDHHRIARYDNPLALNPGAAPSGTLGRSGGIAPTSMHQPHSVAVSPSGRLWVLDTGLLRVLRFDQAAAKPWDAPADGVIGAATPSSNTGFGRTRTRFHNPEVLFLDGSGQLWVSDPNNNRTLKFLPPSSARIIHGGLNSYQQFELSFEALDPGSYHIRSSTDLKNWNLETSYQLSTGDIRTWSWPLSGPARFFRVEEP